MSIAHCLFGGGSLGKWSLSAFKPEPSSGSERGPLLYASQWRWRGVPWLGRLAWPTWAIVFPLTVCLSYRRLPPVLASRDKLWRC